MSEKGKVTPLTAEQLNQILLDVLRQIQQQTSDAFTRSHAKVALAMAAARAPRRRRRQNPKARTRARARRPRAKGGGVVETTTTRSSSTVVKRKKNPAPASRYLARYKNGKTLEFNARSDNAAVRYATGLGQVRAGGGSGAGFCVSCKQVGKKKIR